MLASWDNTENKKTIIDFVEKVTKEGSLDFVPVPERIAVFDNDGTLWTENPSYIEALFSIDRMKEMIAKDSSLKEKEPFKAFIEKDMTAIHEMGKKGLVDFIFETHHAATQEEFNAIVGE